MRPCIFFPCYCLFLVFPSAQMVMSISFEHLSRGIFVLIFIFLNQFFVFLISFIFFPLFCCFCIFISFSFLHLNISVFSYICVIANYIFHFLVVRHLFPLSSKKKIRYLVYNPQFMKIFDFYSFGIYHEAHPTFGSINSLNLFLNWNWISLFLFSISFPHALFWKCSNSWRQGLINTQILFI